MNSYNPVTKSFQRHNGSILCTLDKTSFIEAFGLEGEMDVPIDIDDLQGKCRRNKTYYLNNVMLPYIPYNVKKGEVDSKESRGSFSIDQIQKLFQEYNVWITQGSRK